MQFGWRVDAFRQRRLLKRALTFNKLRLSTKKRRHGSETKPAF